MNPLITERLHIRAARAADAAELHDVSRLNWSRVGNRLRSPDELRTMFAEMESRPPGGPGWYQFVIERLDNGHVIGSIGVNFDGPGDRQAEVGYSLHPAAWGRGYGPEAVAGMLTYLFDEHGLHRVVAITGVDNAASRRLLDRLGFRLEAQTLESFLHHAEGRFVDEVTYALLAREWTRR